MNTQHRALTYAAFDTKLAQGAYIDGQPVWCEGKNRPGDNGQGWFQTLARGGLAGGSDNVRVGGNYAAIRMNALTVAPYDYGIDFTNDPGFNPALTLGRASAGAGVIDYQGNVQILKTGEFGLAGGRRVETLFANTATLATQTVTIASGQSAVISFWGTGTITFSGGATGTLVGTGAANRVHIDKVATGNITCTVSGSCTDAQFEIVEAGVTTPSEYVSNGVGGIRNEFTFTEDFSNPAWVKSAGAIVAGNPTNAGPASLWTPDTATSSHATYQGISVTTGLTYSFFVDVAYAGLQYIQIAGSTGFNAALYQNYDIVNNELKTANLGTATTSMVDMGNGVYRLYYTDVATATASGCRLVVFAISASTSARAESWTPNGTSGYYLYRAQMEQAATSTEYQGIAAAGSPFVDPYHGWNADGVKWFSTDPYGTCLKTPGALGPEKVTNGNFTTDLTGWTANNCTATWVGGIAQLVATATTNAYISQVVSIVKGRTYKVIARFKAKSGNTTPLSARAVLDNATAAAATNTILNDGIWETHVTDWVATATTTTATIQCAGLPIAGTTTVGDTAYFDSVSVKEVYAVPCTVLKRRPAITNLHLHSSTVQSWTSLQATTAVDGYTTLLGRRFAQVTPAATLDSHWAYNPMPTATIGVVYTAQIKIASGGAVYVQLTFASASHGASQYANFNLLTGAETASSGLTVTTKSLGEGVHLLTISAAATLAGNNGLVVVPLLTGTETRNPTLTLTGAEIVLLADTQVETGTVANDHVPTTTAAATALAEDIQLYPDKMDYDQQGGTFALELQSDKASAVEAGNQIALSAYTNASNYGQFANASGAVSHSVLTGGVSQVSANGSTWAADTMFRIGWKLEANNVRLVKDGAAIVNDTAAVVPPVSGIYLGSRPGATNKFSGGFSKLLYNRPGTISDAQILTLTASALPQIGGI